MKPVVRTALKVCAALVVGWVSAGVMFCVALVTLINRRIPRYNGYLRSGK